MNEPRDATQVPSLPRILLVSLLARLWLAGATGLGIDESYAVTVARPFSLSYFDHPPLHFWIAGAMTAMTRSMAPLVVRLPFVLLFTVTLWAVAALTTVLFSERAGRLAALALALSGVLGVTTGTWVLPDGPLDAATSVAAWLLAPILVANDEPVQHAWWHWPAAGFALSLALLSKYQGALIGAGLIGFLLSTVHGRQLLRTRAPWVAAAIALTGCIPVLWWNANHHWVSLAFQGSRAVPRAASLAPFAENIAGQTLYLLPWVFIPLAIALWRAMRLGRADVARWYCVCLAIVPIALFTLVTLGGSRGLPHWQAPGWLFAFPLLGALLDDALKRRATWPVWWMRGSLIATSSLLLLLLAQAQWGVLDSRLSTRSRSGDPTRDAVSWEPVVRRLSAAGRLDTDTTVLLARNWMQAGKLGIAVGVQHWRVECVCDDARHFAFRYAEPRPWTHAVLVESVGADDASVTPPLSVAGDSLRIVPIETLDVGRGVRLAAFDVVRVPRQAVR